MGKIEVNEYVRTELGIIYEYTEDEKNDWQIRDFRLCNDGEIVNHSKQLIDLIEVTDIIKYRMNNISTTLETKGYIEGIVDISDKEMLQRIKNDKNYVILEILTHEQFEQNSYKVGGEDEC